MNTPMKYEDKKALENNEVRAFDPTKDLSQRAIRGGIWVLAIRIADRLFGLVRTVVLARLLAPQDFGLMGIVLLSMMVLEIFAETGFQAALIQKKKDIKPYLDTAWVVQVMRGLLLFGILLAAAPLVSKFFNAPMAVIILRVMAISELFKGLTSVGIVFFQRELEFNKQFVYQFSGTVADLAVAIPAALILRSVWALVLGLLAGSVTRCVVSYIIHPYRPGFKVDWTRARELFRFGRWVLVSTIMVFIGTHGDDAVVGKIIGVAALGFYQMAYRISQMVITEIMLVISRIAFVVYSKLQESVEDLQKSYSRISSLSSALTIPMATGILVLGKDFTRIVLGEKWLPMVPALSILAVAVLLESMVLTGSSLFVGRGKPKFDFQMQLVRALTIVILIYPFSLLWGISGAAFTVVLSALGTGIVYYRRLKKELRVALPYLSRIFGPPLISSSVMVVFIFTLKFFIKTFDSVNLLPGVILLFLTVCLAVFVYFFIVSLFQRIIPEYQVLHDIHKIIKKE